MPKISVIVPVYKAEDFLHECVDSILKQTFENFELILVDDGSPDDCGFICDMYASKDIRIRVIHQDNQGQSTARNYAVNVALGEWICFVDSDDIIHPQMLEKLYNAVISTNSNMSMCSALESTTCPATFWNSQETSYTSIHINETELIQLYSHVKHKAWVVWGKLIRKSIVKQIPFANGKIYEDNAIVCRWLVCSNIIADIDTPLYFYRINPAGTTKCLFSIKHLDYLWALEEIIFFFDDLNYQLLLKRFYEIYLTTSADYYVKVLKELKNRKIAHCISKKMRKLYQSKKSIIVIPKEKKKKIYTAMYPCSKFFWYSKTFLFNLKRAITFSQI